MTETYNISRRRLIGEAWFWLVIILIFAAVLSFGALGWRYVIAGPKGAVGAREIQQGAQNRVQQQAKFEQLAADYTGYLVQIRNAQAALVTASATTRPQRETELLGLRQICVTTAQDFNAESRKYVARDWKSAGLPLTLNPTACEGGTP
jgi:hypothetical protein